jgi:hypothetical protein
MATKEVIIHTFNGNYGDDKCDARAAFLNKEDPSSYYQCTYFSLRRSIDGSTLYGAQLRKSDKPINK